jgi:hypothetical protein
MKVAFKITHFAGFEHVLAVYETRNKEARLDDFEEGIKKRYPDFDRYYWRVRPIREQHRNFGEKQVKIRFTARFSVRLDGQPHANPVGDEDGTNQ